MSSLFALLVLVGLLLAVFCQVYVVLVVAGLLLSAGVAVSAVFALLH